MTESLKSALRQSGVLAAWVILAVIWFWPVRRAGWASDIMGLIPMLDQQGFQGWLSAYGAPVLHPLTLGVYALLYEWFGATSLAWFAVWVGLHGLNACLIYTLTNSIGRSLYGQTSKWIAVGAGLLFLLHPYQVEAVTWRATINYLLSTVFLLASTQAAFLYGRDLRSKHLYLMLMLYAGALLSFDLALVGPILLGLSVVLARWPNGGYLVSKPLITTFLASTTTLIIYLLAKWAYVGSMVGHYGAEIHLNYSPSVLLGNFWRLLTKTLFLTRELSFSSKQALDAAFNNLWLTGGLFAVCAVLLLICLSRRRPDARALGLLILMVGIAFAPVSNLFMYYLLAAGGDRYGYLPTAFGAITLSIAVAIVLQNLSFRVARGALVLGALSYLAIMAFVSKQQVQMWAESSFVQRSLVADFARFDPGAQHAAQVPILLTAADNYQGAYLFTDNHLPYQAFASSLRWLGNHTHTDSVREIVTFNQMDLLDSTAAYINNLGEIELNFRQGGNWWWRGGLGLSDYEDDLVRVTAGEPVRICFRQNLPSGKPLLYQTGTTWAQLDPTGLRICSEVDALRATNQ